jgi:hypothetical protein
VRESEPVKIAYDREVIEAALTVDPAPPSSANAPPRLRIDLSAVPAWNIRPIPANTRKRIAETPEPPRWRPPGAREWWEL